jgi:CheY-like chemotaxis protein
MRDRALRDRTPVPADICARAAHRPHDRGRPGPARADTSVIAMTQRARPVRVVIIDDTLDLRELLRLALTRGGLDVVGEAGDGLSGIECVRLERPDVVLLDLSMPVMDGLEALPTIRRLVPDSKIVVLPGFGATQMSEKAMTTGADGYLQKGMPLKRIVEYVKDIVDAPLPHPKRVLQPVPEPEPPSPPLLSVVLDDTADLPGEAAADASVPRVSAWETMETAAQEIRGPVAVLCGIAESITQAGDDMSEVQRHRLMSSVTRQARTLDSITADLLTAAEIQRGTLHLDLQEVEPLSVIDTVISDRHLVTVSAQVEDDRRVVADPLRLEQMLANLVGNALKYGRAPYVVRVEAEPHDRTLLRIVVIDSGEGVPQNHRETLFGALSGPNGAVADGAGLGLYVVRCLAERLGGSVAYSSGPTGGAVFTLTLPAV